MSDNQRGLVFNIRLMMIETKQGEKVVSIRRCTRGSWRFPCELQCFLHTVCVCWNIVAICTSSSRAHVASSLSNQDIEVDKMPESNALLTYSADSALSGITGMPCSLNKRMSLRRSPARDRASDQRKNRIRFGFVSSVY